MLTDGNYFFGRIGTKITINNDGHTLLKFEMPILGDAALPARTTIASRAMNKISWLSIAKSAGSDTEISQSMNV
jgi:hypothetical protein